MEHVTGYRPLGTNDDSGKGSPTGSPEEKIIPINSPPRETKSERLKKLQERANKK